VRLRVVLARLVPRLPPARPLGQQRPVLAALDLFHAVGTQEWLAHFLVIERVDGAQLALRFAHARARHALLDDVWQGLALVVHREWRRGGLFARALDAAVARPHDLGDDAAGGALQVHIVVVGGASREQLPWAEAADRM
jgi:GNAT superfamily N-acetyltransferase